MSVSFRGRLPGGQIKGRKGKYLGGVGASFKAAKASESAHDKWERAAPNTLADQTLHRIAWSQTELWW